jgi:hypothetical protein
MRLLADVLPALSDKDPRVRARAAQHFDYILAVRGVSWEAAAYVIATYADRAAEANAAGLLL